MANYVKPTFMVIGAISKKGELYYALAVDVGYIKYLTFDVNIIARCMGISAAELYRNYAEPFEYIIE